jgi:hypothetical protein
VTSGVPVSPSAWIAMLMAIVASNIGFMVCVMLVFVMRVI